MVITLRDELWFVNMGYTNNIWLIDYNIVIICNTYCWSPPQYNTITYNHGNTFAACCASLSKRM